MKHIQKYLPIVALLSLVHTNAYAERRERLAENKGPKMNEASQPTKTPEQGFKVTGGLSVGMFADFQHYPSAGFSPSMIQLEEDKNNKHRFTGPTLMSASFGATKTVPFLNGMPEGSDTVDIVTKASFAGETFKLREIYVKHANFIVGYTVTNFCDLDAFPGVLGAPCGAIVVRCAPQITWKQQLPYGLSYAVAVEKTNLPVPEAKKDRDKVFPDRYPCKNIPACTGNIRYSNDRGHIQMSGLFRVFEYHKEKEPSYGINFSFTGGGNLAGAFDIIPKKTTVKACAHYGSGIASWTIDFAAMPEERREDIYTKYEGKTERIKNVNTWGGYVGVQQCWIADKLKSTLVLSMIDARGKGAYKQGYHAAVNAMYSPTKDISLGIEYEFGRKHVIDEKKYLQGVSSRDINRNAQRVTVLATYSFSG